MDQTNCIFCKIIEGEIPSNTIYEDEDFKVILDVAPVSKGHALLIPKRHSADLFELPREVAAKVLLLAACIGKAMKQSLKCDGINLIQNNGECAWQSVFHFHVHIIPRFKDDKVVFPQKGVVYHDGEAAEYAERINQSLINHFIEEYKSFIGSVRS